MIVLSSHLMLISLWLFTVCGSLSRGPDRPVRKGKSCECDDGWTGINCNVCTNDNVCNAFTETGDGGVCYTGGEVVKQNYQICDVTNKAIRNLLGTKVPQVTFTCKKETGECDFQCKFLLLLLGLDLDANQRTFSLGRGTRVVHVPLERMRIDCQL